MKNGEIEIGDVGQISGEGDTLWVVTMARPGGFSAERIIDGTPSGWEENAKLRVLSPRVARMRLLQLVEDLAEASARAVVARKALVRR